MSTPTKRVAFHTLGCKLNFSETATISRDFIRHGFEKVDYRDEADIYVLNTCSVTENADKEARKLIRQAKRRNPNSSIAVIGCYAQLKPNDIAAIEGVDIVLGAEEKFNLLNHLDSIDLNIGTKVIQSEIDHLHTFTPSYSSGERTRSFLKVQDGCDYTCSFCTIINVQGHKSRDRSIESIENIIRFNVKQGLSSFFISDDDFARNKNWESILDKFIELREVHKLKISFTIQVDTLCHKLPGFIEKSGRAGVKRAFIGLENINPDSLLGASKRQNKITDYRAMLLAWKKVGVITCCGYILGFPNDTRKSILQDIEIIKKELPVDLLEFFYLTPFPGSEDHKKLHTAGVAMDKDLNMYDANHPVTAHSNMSKENWEEAFHKAWEAYYTYEHTETLLKRGMVTGTSPSKTIGLITWFKGCVSIEKVHPLEGGFFRRKSRKDRRPTLPIESPFVFYPKYFSEIIWKHFCWILLVIRMRLICKRVRNDPKNREYMDLSLEPVIENETQSLELFQSEAAKKFVEKRHRFEKMRHNVTPTS